MSKRKVLSVVLILYGVLLWVSSSYSLDEATHKAINEDITRRAINGFSLDGYLRNYLGFELGSSEALWGLESNGVVIHQRVFWWLGYGGMQEDRPGSRSDYIFNRPTRSINHFHNPLKPWAEAGLDDYFVVQRLGLSQVLWAQSLYQYVGGPWS
jgi:hypothetical protein